MDTVTPCGSCLCNTCQLNVDADRDICHCDDMYCYNCDDCSEMFGTRFRYIELGSCKLYRNGAPIKMKHNKNFNGG